MSTGIRDELFLLKGKLELLEKELTDQMMELEVKAQKWHDIDEEAEKTTKSNNQVINIDVGGRKFQTKLETLMSVKDTLFYKLFLSNKLDLTKEIFIDRNGEVFGVILSFLRNKKVNLNTFSNVELKKIAEDAEFYQVADLLSNLNESLSEIYFVGFESNGQYRSGTTLAGTDNIDDLNNHEDRSLMKGICATSPGVITFELNREADIQEIEIAGWGGNTGIWATSNGGGARVLTSTNKTNWVDVGTVGNNYSVISKVSLTQSKGKYIRIQSTTYLGIGYFKITKTD